MPTKHRRRRARDHSAIWIFLRSTRLPRRLFCGRGLCQPQLLPRLFLGRFHRCPSCRRQGSNVASQARISDHGITKMGRVLIGIAEGHVGVEILLERGVHPTRGGYQTVYLLAAKITADDLK